MKSALLVIDMINDFLKEGAPLEVPMGRDIIPRIQEAVLTASVSKYPIVLVSDAHVVDDKEFKLWPKHAVIGTNGAMLFDKLKDFILAEKIGFEYINKQTYSGFFHTRLDDLLKSKKVKRVFVTGILTNICVFVTAVEAQMRGYEVRILKDGVAALTQEENYRTLEQLEKVFKVKIL